MCKQHPKTTGVDYAVKDWALAMMLMALPLVHFCVNERANDDLCEKNIKNADMISVEPIDF